MAVRAQVRHRQRSYCAVRSTGPEPRQGTASGSSMAETLAHTKLPVDWSEQRRLLIAKPIGRKAHLSLNKTHRQNGSQRKTPLRDPVCPTIFLSELWPGPRLQRDRANRGPLRSFRRPKSPPRKSAGLVGGVPGSERTRLAKSSISQFAQYIPTPWGTAFNPPTEPLISLLSGENTGNSAPW